MKKIMIYALAMLLGLTAIPASSETAANWAFAAMALNSEAANVGSIYFADSFFAAGRVNPLTVAAYTEEEIAAIKAGRTAGQDGYVENLPEGAVIGMSVYGGEEIFWFDAEGAEAIVTHADPLALNAESGELMTAEGTVAATALAR